MADEPSTQELDLSKPVADEDARGRFSLIAALLEPLIDRTHGEVQEGLAEVRRIARAAAGEPRTGAPRA